MITARKHCSEESEFRMELVLETQTHVTYRPTPTPTPDSIRLTFRDALRKACWVTIACSSERFRRVRNNTDMSAWCRESIGCQQRMTCQLCKAGHPLLHSQSRGKRTAFRRAVRSVQGSPKEKSSPGESSSTGVALRVSMMLTATCGSQYCPTSR